MRPSRAQVSALSSCGSMPNRARTPPPATTVEPTAATAKTRPMTMPASILAERATPRRGVARKVGVRVLWRYSPVTSSVPTMSGKT